MADDQTTTESGEETPLVETAPEPTIDYSWAPEAFVKDGQLDTEAFRADYDAAAAIRAQHAEREEGLPQSIDEIKIEVPEDLKLPEGVTMPEGFELKIDESDPRVSMLKQTAIERKWDQDTINEVLRMEAVAQVQAEAIRQEESANEIKALGPDANARIETVRRNLASRLPEAQANDLADSITSADGLRGLEALLGPIKHTAQTPGGKIDHSNMTIDQRLELAAQQRAARRAS